MRSGALRFVLLCCVLLVAGCFDTRYHDLLNVKPAEVPASDIAATHEIFVATTRSRATEDPSQLYTGQRSLTAGYARVTMSVPKIHQVGRIERAKGASPADPSKDFAARAVKEYAGPAEFSSALSQDIAHHGNRVLVFVHGYNTGFDDGVYRITQIQHDTRYPGTPVLFSWASGARTRDYIYDRDSAMAARDDLESTLRMLARSRASSIDIIAHSMGTWLTMEALRQLAISGDRDLGGKLGYVVLASPDIDVDVFKTQMLRYGKPNRPFALLLSGDDKALRISGAISGDKKRLGDYDDPADLATYGVTVFDLTGSSSGDKLNHTKFADNPVLVQLLGDRLRAPASLTISEAAADQQIDRLGKAVGSMAEVIVTTPFKMFTLGGDPRKRGPLPER